MRDLIAFFIEVYRSIKEDRWFQAQPRWWLSRNVARYAENSGDTPNGVCGFFWTAVYLWPVYWVTGKRHVLASTLNYLIPCTLFLVGFFAVVGVLDQRPIQALIIFSILGWMVILIRQFSKGDEVMTRSRLDFRADFQLASPLHKPVVVVQYGIIYAIMGTMYAVLIIPWSIYEWLTDRYCPVVEYVEE